MTPVVLGTLFASIAVAVAFVAWIVARHLGESRHTKAALIAGKQYHDLADEYRRLSDLAITAQEHTDLRLTELSVQLSDLLDKFEQVQRILKDVE